MGSSRGRVRPRWRCLKREYRPTPTIDMTIDCRTVARDGAAKAWLLFLFTRRAAGGRAAPPTWVRPAAPARLLSTEVPPRAKTPQKVKALTPILAPRMG